LCTVEERKAHRAQMKGFKNPNNAGEAKREEDGKACPGEAVGS
jgi:hypothetical protein